MRGSSLSFFVEARDALMSRTHDVSFYLSRNTYREMFWISHTRKVLRLESSHYPASLRNEMVCLVWVGCRAAAAYI